MPSYLIELAFESDGVQGRCWLTVRNPFQTADEAISITPECMTPLELDTWANEAKKKIDLAVKQGKKKFAAVRSRRATKK